MEHCKLKQIRGKEGIRVREAYAKASRDTGLEWHGRNYDRIDWKAGDHLCFGFECSLCDMMAIILTMIFGHLALVGIAKLTTFRQGSLAIMAVVGVVLFCLNARNIPLRPSLQAVVRSDSRIRSSDTP